MAKSRMIAQTTTLPSLKRNIVVVPLVLARENWSFDGGQNNGVVCAHVICNCATH